MITKWLEEEETAKEANPYSVTDEQFKDHMGKIANIKFSDSPFEAEKIFLKGLKSDAEGEDTPIDDFQPVEQTGPVKGFFSEMVEPYPQPLMQNPAGEVPLPECVGAPGDTPYSSEQLVHYSRDRVPGEYGMDGTVVAEPTHYRNIKDLMARYFLTAHLQMGGVRNWRNQCIGVTSYDISHQPGLLWLSGDTPHMPMLDYDGKNVKKRIRKDVKLLQEGFSLGDAWVYKTRHGYHIYFFTDRVSKSVYMDILSQVQCCKGFKKSATDKGYAVLRVSAKYTAFDIAQEYVLRSKERHPRRMTAKAHLIQNLLAMGMDSGTHLATLFPEQALYKEDVKTWKPPINAKKGKRIRKIKNIQAQSVAVPAPANSATWANNGWGNSTTSTPVTYSTTTGNY